MKNKHIEYIKPGTALAGIEKHNVPQYALAALVGISDATISLWLAGKCRLSAGVQGDIIKAIGFFEYLASSYDVPVDFSNVEELRPHWRRFREMKAEEAKETV